jgi:hypothetical protein
VSINELLSCAQSGCIIGLIARKFIDPNKTMAVDTEDVGPIFSHGTAPLNEPRITIRLIFGSKLGCRVVKMGRYLPMEHRLSGGEGFPVNIHEVALERVRARLGET